MIALVTGSAGFLGRHFVADLKRRGWDVAGWDIVTGQCALAGFRYILDSCVNVDLVIHCAAIAPHRAAIDGKALAVGAGCLELDAAMFQWAARTRPGRVVYFSSSAVYPVGMQAGHQPYRLAEEDADRSRPVTAGLLEVLGDFGPLAPDAIYGELKVMGERLVQAYREQGGAVTVLRPFSGYGEDQSADFPFGAFRDRARRREDPFVVWGDGSQVRDWVHVDDVVGATLAAVEHEVNGPVNVCTGRGVSMAELAEMFAAQAGYSPTLEFRHEAPTGVAYRVGDPTRLNKFYTPKVSLEEGVRRAMAREVAR